jgi:hypothetical protein
MCTPRKVIECANGGLPEALGEYYEKQLSDMRNSSGSSGDGLRIIGIVFHATRPLSVLELQHALATEEHDDTFVSKGICEENEILRQTNNLISVNHAGNVSLRHHTFGEYLSNGKSVPEIRLRTSCEDLARTCMVYLMFKEFRQEYQDKEQCCLDRPFLRYAVDNVGRHVSACIVRDEISTNEATEFLKGDVPVTSLQLAAERIITMSLPARAKELLVRSSVLHLAILWGFFPIVESLLNGGTETEVQGYMSMRPLQIAACTFSRQTAKLLISKDVDVNHIDDQGRTALDFIVMRPWRDIYYEDMQRGHKSRVAGLMASLMREVEAWLDSSTANRSLLQIPVARKAIEDVLRVVPDDREAYWDEIKLNWESWAERAATLLSSSDRRMDITEAGEEVALDLLDAGADVESVEYHEASPLQLAALYGRHRLVQSLIDHGANPFVKGCPGLTAFEIASMRAQRMPENSSYQAIVQALAKAQEDGLGEGSSLITTRKSVPVQSFSRSYRWTDFRVAR